MHKNVQLCYYLRTAADSTSAYFNRSNDVEEEHSLGRAASKKEGRMSNYPSEGDGGECYCKKSRCCRERIEVRVCQRGGGYEPVCSSRSRKSNNEGRRHALGRELASDVTRVLGVAALRWRKTGGRAIVATVIAGVRYAHGRAAHRGRAVRSRCRRARYLFFIRLVTIEFGVLVDPASVHLAFCGSVINRSIPSVLCRALSITYPFLSGHASYAGGDAYCSSR